MVHDMPDSETIRVLLADDHGLVRRGIAGLLADEPDIEVVGEASDGEEAVERARELMPDIILMDISMPRMNGLEATRRIKQILPYVRILMLTASDEDRDLVEAIKGGAQGYLLKKIEPRMLTDALRGVMRGEAPLSRVMAGRLLAEFAKKLQPGGSGPRPETELSSRETEILSLLSQGMSNKQIAAALTLAENTVRNHLRNILAKLHLENRVQAAIFAHRHGLAGQPPESVK